jgi:hypothetical protein
MYVKVEEYPRETVEYVPFENVTVNGQPWVGGFNYSITENFARPTVWTPTVPVEGKQSFLLNGPSLGVGLYKVWVQVADGDESVVILAGQFKVS